MLLSTTGSPQKVLFPPILAISLNHLPFSEVLLLGNFNISSPASWPFTFASVRIVCHILSQYFYSFPWLFHCGYSEETGGSDGKESACSAGDPGSIPGQEDPREKGMAVHSSILSCRSPWTEEPDRPQSMGYKGSDMTERLTFSLTEEACTQLIIPLSVLDTINNRSRCFRCLRSSSQASFLNENRTLVSSQSPTFYLEI